MTRDLARRVRALEANAPADRDGDEDLGIREWLGEQLTPDEQERLRNLPPVPEQTAEEWDAMSLDSRKWFEERDIFRPGSDQGRSA